MPSNENNKVNLEALTFGDAVVVWSRSNTKGWAIPDSTNGKFANRIKTYRRLIASGDGNKRHFSLLKYWRLILAPQYRNKRAPNDYEQHKAYVAKRNAEFSKQARDIGDLPEVVNPGRKAECEKSFRAFCETYFSHTFSLDWSPDHLKAIGKIEQSVLHGGLFALAMPRGSGKSSLSETACIWAMLYGHREFIALVGSTEVAALEILDSIKTSIESNPELSEDFPEVTYPIHQLDGIANRCAGQLYHGERTRITWTSNEIVLPTIEGSRASGIVVRVAGITGRVRGMKFKRQDGRSVRPSLVIIDDPQTAESAGSIEQTKKRVRVLVGDILGLAGPGQKISGIMPCTIIRPGDMADQILDAGKHPEWNGERCKMIYEYPKNMDLWEQYAEIRMESLREDGNFKRATEFYAEHRAEMDEGAVVSWEARHNHDEISALQNAMNLKFQDEIAFQSEYQNEPVPEDLAEDNILSVDEIIQKISGVPKGVVPLDCVRVTMFVDIQKTLLFYCICAWSDDFTGSVIDYGAWPDQHRLRFTLADAGPTIQDKFKKAGFEGQLFGALTALFEEKMGQEFRREDGAVLRIERAMIDANWGLSTDIVYQFCRTSQWASLVYPAHGRYVGATSKPMTEYRKERGARLGFNWYMPSIIGKRAVRHVIFDTNFWKSFVHARLAVALGDKGSLTLYGRNPLLHQLFAEHLTAEYKVAVEAKGRKVDEWKLRPQRADNHWLDCLAGCAVCASMQGSALPVQMNAPAQKERIHLSARQASHQAISFPDNYAPSPAAVQSPARIKLSDLQKTKNYAMT